MHGGRLRLLAVAVAVAILALGAAACRRNTLGPRASDRRESLLADLGFVALCPGLLLIAATAVRAGPGLSAADPFLVAGVLLLVADLVLSPRETPVVPRWLIVAGGAILLTGLVSAVFADRFGQNLLPAARFAVALSVGTAAIAVAASTPKRRTIIAGLWVTAAAISALIAVADSVFGTEIGPRLTGLVFNAGARVGGLANHPNQLAAAAVIALPVALAYAGAPRIRASERWVAIGLVCVLVAGVLVSGSRAGAIALPVVVLATAAWAAPGRFRRQQMFVAGALVVAVIALLVVNPNIASVTTSRLGASESTAVSDESRRELMTQAVSHFLDRPLTGHGFAESRAAHMIYLQVLAAGGLLALLAFVLFFAGTISRGRNAMRAVDLPPSDRALALGCTVAVVAWMVLGLVQNMLYDRYLYVAPGLVLALAAAVGSRQVVGRQRDGDQSAASGGVPPRGPWTASV